jgi:hypothetical protein
VEYDHLLYYLGSTMSDDFYISPDGKYLLYVGVEDKVNKGDPGAVPKERDSPLRERRKL